MISHKFTKQIRPFTCYIMDQQPNLQNQDLNSRKNVLVSMLKAIGKKKRLPHLRTEKPKSRNLCKGNTSNKDNKHQGTPPIRYSEISNGSEGKKNVIKEVTKLLPLRLKSFAISETPISNVNHQVPTAISFSKLKTKEMAEKRLNSFLHLGFIFPGSKAHLCC